MKVLNEEGQRRFRDWVLSIEDSPFAAPPLNLLENDEFSYIIPGSVDLKSRVFATKLDLAKAILPCVEAAESQNISHDCWPGIWDTLALFYFESICPRHADGAWHPRRVEHYVYDPSWTVRHRHRVYGPVTLYRLGGEHVDPFFRAQPCVLGDLEEQVGSRMEVASNPVALRVIRALYVHKKNDGIISGYTNRKNYAGFKNKLPAPGTLRRFIAIYDQLNRTYDLAGISYEGFLSLLPAEFGIWVNS